MRVLDFGTTGAVRSQSCWHALARCVQDGDPPTLSFVRPAAPYVSLGYHHRVDELDVVWCAAEGLPVLRRMVGGGPVYLDPDQWFFQITLPVRSVPGRRDRALRALLEPAVQALRSLDVPAVLDEFGEISVGPAKVCGHGAGQLRSGAVVVGNLITGFDHERAARVLALGSADRARVTKLMHRHVGTTRVDPAAWQAAMITAYARYFGREPVPTRATDAELVEAERLDGLLGDPEFLSEAQAVRSMPRQVKIRGGIYVEVAAA